VVSGVFAPTKVTKVYPCASYEGERLGTIGALGKRHEGIIWEGGWEPLIMLWGVNPLLLKYLESVKGQAWARSECVEKRMRGFLKGASWILSQCHSKKPSGKRGQRGAPIGHLLNDPVVSSLQSGGEGALVNPTLKTAMGGCNCLPHQERHKINT